MEQLPLITPLTLYFTGFLDPIEWEPPEVDDEHDAQEEEQEPSGAWPTCACEACQELRREWEWEQRAKLDWVSHEDA